MQTLKWSRFGDPRRAYNEDEEPQLIGVSSSLLLSTLCEAFLIGHLGDATVQLRILAVVGHKGASSASAAATGQCHNGTNGDGAVLRAVTRISGGQARKHPGEAAFTWNQCR